MSCLTQLDHSGVLVSDFERSKKFYMDVLGMDMRRDSSDLDPAIGTPNFQVKAGDCVLFMFRNLKPGESKDIRPGPAPHFEFTVSDPDTAESYLSKAAQNLPRNSVVQDHYGDLLAKRGRSADAIAAWRKALDGDGQDIEKPALEKKIRDAKPRR